MRQAQLEGHSTKCLTSIPQNCRRQEKQRKLRNPHKNLETLTEEINT